MILNSITYVILVFIYSLVNIQTQLIYVVQFISCNLAKLTYSRTLLFILGFFFLVPYLGFYMQTGILDHLQNGFISSFNLYAIFILFLPYCDIQNYLVWCITLVIALHPWNEFLYPCI